MWKAVGRAYSQYRRAAPYVKAVARGAKRAYNSYKSNTNKRAKTTKNNSVSFQHDFQSQYTRRRAPRRVVKKARRQAKAFNYQLSKGVAQYSRSFPLIFAPSTITPTSMSNSQTVYNVGLYGGNGVSLTGMGSWFDICQDAGMLTNTGKVYCKSACLDVQIRNEDDTDTLVLDAYRYVARREGYDEPAIEWGQGLVNQSAIPGSVTPLTGLSFECTPFDAPGFGSKYLITGKTRYRIGPNNSVYLQMRDPRNHVFETGRFDYDAGSALNRIKMFKGMTKGWIFVARSAQTDATNAFMGPVNWKVIQNQSYHYSFVESSEDRQGQS